MPGQTAAAGLAVATVLGLLVTAHAAIAGAKKEVLVEYMEARTANDGEGVWRSPEVR